MVRMSILWLAVLAFTFAVAPLGTPPAAAQKQEPNTQQQPRPGKGDAQASKTITGTIAAIGTGGRSFTLQVAGGKSDSQTMNFVLDENTQVQGKVKVGTPVSVEYQAMAEGQNLAISITVQA